MLINACGGMHSLQCHHSYNHLRQMAVMAVVRSPLALLLSILLLCAATLTVSSSQNILDEEVGQSLAANKHKHKHSGFSLSECPGACEFRCSKTAYKKPCMFFCQKCCFKCRCVPPGTWAHKEVCPCYNNWKTQTGGPKCP